MEPILVVGPDGAKLDVSGRLLEGREFLLLSAEGPQEALALTRKHRPRVVVIDLGLETGAGLALCDAIKRDPNLPFIAVLLIGPAAPGDAPEYDRLLREPGVFATARDVERSELLSRLQNLTNLVRGIRQRADVQVTDAGPRGLKHLIGRSSEMLRVYQLLHSAALADCSVLILGETGTGKELVARTLHELSGRRRGPYVAVNLAAFNENVVESELFGHEQGAFTGAMRRRIGCLERANGGTLYLDEVGSVPLALQIKLLRALQERRFERVGGESAIPVDFRLVASATGLNQLRLAIANNAFRRDFFYRLHGVIIPLPPLRERTGDIELLLEHFFEHLAAKYGRALRLGPHALAPLLEHRWPGNVRELERAVEAAVVLSSSDTIESIPLLDDPAPAQSPDEAAEGGSVERAAALSGGLSYSGFVEQQRERELEFFRELLKRFSGDRRQAMRYSGLSRATFYRRLRELGLVERNFAGRGDKSPD